MKTVNNRKPDHEHHALSAAPVQRTQFVSASSSFIDKRPQASLQRHMQAVAEQSPLNQAAAQLKALLDNRAGQQSALHQRQEIQAGQAADHASEKSADLPPGTRQAEVSELSEADALEYVTASFKKGGGEKPLVNASGALVQRAVKRSYYAGGELFAITASDLGKGTGTTQGTRDYVNHPSTYKPDTVLFDYATGSNAAGGTKKVTASDDAYDLDNPEADRSYKSGKTWDAGHKLGRQNGGLGNVNDWVFPQNPAFNQGNSRNMDDVEETHPLWRGHEDDFHEGVKNDGAGAWWIKLV